MSLNKSIALFPIDSLVIYKSYVYKVLAHGLGGKSTYLEDVGFVPSYKLTRHKSNDTITDVMSFIRNWTANHTTTNTDPVVEWTLSERAT